MDAENNTLTVLETYTRDVGHGVARIDGDLMAVLGLSKGDIIEIKGRRTTAAKCLPSLTPQQLKVEQIQLALAHEKLHKTEITEKTNPETKFDWTKRCDNVHEMTPITPGKTIRIDGLIRNNAGIAIGNTVSIRKISSPCAEKITVVPLENIPPIDERYLADALDTMPVTKGDNIMIPYFGGRLTFQVMDIVPGVVSTVTRETVFSITSQGPTLRTDGDFKYYSDGKKITLVLEEAVRQETQEDSYLILKIHLHHGGFGAIGEFQIRLEKNMTVQKLVLRYKDLAQEIVETANKKLSESRVNSADLVNDVKFKIIEKWRIVSNS